MSSPRSPAIPKPPPATPAVIRVVLADDSVLFREGIARVLAENGFAVAGQAGNADELDVLVDRASPDVVVTDIRMPPTNTNEGLLAAQRIRARHPRIGVLVLSHYVETRQAIKLLQNAPQGVGYLLKDRVSDIAEFADTVRRVAHGGSAIDPEVVAHLLRRRRKAARTGPSASGCSSHPRPSRPTSEPSSPNWACCPQPTTTGGSSPSSPTSKTPDRTPWREE